MVVGTIIRIFEKSFIILGLTFFSGVFSINSLGLLVPEAIITLMRFFIWGMSTILICILWKSTIITVNGNKLLYILTALAFFSFCWSVFPSFTFFDSRDVLMMTSFSLYFAIRFSLKEQVQLIAITLLIGSLLSVIFALKFPIIAIHGVDGIDAHPGAWKGVYGHKNVLGSMMVLNSLTFFTLSKDNSNLYKYFGLFLSIILMLLSTSKTSLIIYFCLVLIMVLYKKFRWQGKISVIFIDIGILIFGCIALLVFTYWVELLTGLGRDSTLTGRIPIWSYALTKLMERPFLGFGRGAFWAPESEYAIEAGQALGTSWIPPHAHNGLIDLALDIGLIGVSLFLIIYLTAFAKTLKRAYATKDLENLWPLAFLTFLAMNNVTESYLLRQANLYWVLFTTVVLTLNQKKQIQKISNLKSKSSVGLT